MNLNFEYYKIFYYVCKCGSLTGAANVLMTSQPARDPHHPQPGKRYWLPSLYPQQKRRELTPEGRTFYKYISAACAQIFKGENELAGMISLDNGTVCISATETALHCCLFKAMEEFNRSYPSVIQLKLLNNSTVHSIQALKSGR